MIKAIVFDLDGMVSKEYDWFSKAFSKKYNIVWETVLEFFFNEYKQCLVGRADVKEEFMKYVEKWGLGNLSWKEVEDLWFSENVVIESEMIDLILRLRKQGILCVLASNNEEYKRKYFSANYNLDSTFDEVVFSYEVGAKKPKPEFTNFLLEKIGLNPDEIFFCDDTKENIDELEKQGFQTYLYSDFSKFINELKRLGLKV